MVVTESSSNQIFSNPDFKNPQFFEIPVNPNQKSFQFICQTQQFLIPLEVSKIVILL